MKTIFTSLILLTAGLFSLAANAQFAPGTFTGSLGGGGSSSSLGFAGGASGSIGNGISGSTAGSSSWGSASVSNTIGIPTAPIAGEPGNVSTSNVCVFCASAVGEGTGQPSYPGGLITTVSSTGGSEGFQSAGSAGQAGAFSLFGGFGEGSAGGGGGGDFNFNSFP